MVEGNAGAMAGAAADRRAREAAPVGPETRLRPREDLLLGLDDRDPDVVLAQDRRDRQPGAEGGRRQRRGRLCRQRQATAPAADRQERGQGATAEGAEESSAPEAATRR